MSTRCRIGIQNKDGTITSIYCHHDGYVSYVGSMLANHYTDEAKIKQLMDLGDMSSLGTVPVGNPDGWDFSKRAYEDETKCITYKDRGEDCPATTSKDEEEYLKLTEDCWGEYAYLFKDGEWYVSPYDEAFHKVKEDNNYKETA